MLWTYYRVHEKHFEKASVSERKIITPNSPYARDRQRMKNTRPERTDSGDKIICLFERNTTREAYAVENTRDGKVVVLHTATD